jgi:uncharacterized protein (DUF2267 family)
MEHELEVIDRTVAKTYEWLRAVAGRGNFDDLHQAYQVLRAVLQALRDRLSPDVAGHLSAQLPMLVRGVFYEGWDPGRTPDHMSLSDFLVRVEKEANLKGTSEAEDATRAVMAVLWDELGEGTMEHLMSVLPRGFAVLL